VKTFPQAAFPQMKPLCIFVSSSALGMVITPLKDNNQLQTYSVDEAKISIETIQLSKVPLEKQAS
jgi:hypothetical protein